LLEQEYRPKGAVALQEETQPEKISPISEALLSTEPSEEIFYIQNRPQPLNGMPEYETIPESVQPKRQMAFEAAPEPGIIKRIKQSLYKPVMPGEKPIGTYREEQPFRTIAKAGAFYGAKALSGLGLYIPDIITGKVSSEKSLADLVNKLTGFKPTQNEIKAGESVEFITGLQTAGGLTGSLVKRIAARQALKTMLSAGLTFATRRAAKETADKIVSGDPIDFEGIHFEGGIGVLFGAGEVGLGRFLKWISGFKKATSGSAAEVRAAARAEVYAALRKMRETGDRTAWDAMRVKYAGISPEVAARAAPPPPVKDFGRFPLAKASVQPSQVVGKIAGIAPKAPEAPPVKKGVATPAPAPVRPLAAKPEAKIPTREVKPATPEAKQPWEMKKAATEDLNRDISEGIVTKSVPAMALPQQENLVPRTAPESSEAAAELESIKLEKMSQAKILQPWEMLEKEWTKYKQSLTTDDYKFRKNKFIEGNNYRDFISISVKNNKDVPVNVLTQFKGVKWADQAIKKRQLEKTIPQEEKLKIEAEFTKAKQGEFALQVAFQRAVVAKDTPKIKTLKLQTESAIERLEKVHNAMLTIKGKRPGDALQHAMEAYHKTIQKLKSLEEHKGEKWADEALAKIEKGGGKPTEKKPPKVSPPKKGELSGKTEQVHTAKVTPPILAEVQKVLDKKAFISEKGKIKPGARLLAKQFIGKTNINKMTEEELAKYARLLRKLPEPRMVHGRLVPPSIPRTTALTRPGQFERRFQKPTPVMFVTDQSYYAEKLGVKSIVEPLEKAKVRFDLEYRSAANELDKQGKLIDKAGRTTGRERIAAKVKNIPTRARVEMGQLLDSYEEAPAGLSPEKKKVFNWFRRLTRATLEKQNEARSKLDMPPIKGRKAYMRHIATDISKEMLAGRYPFPEGVKFWSSRVAGKKIFNPMEYQRKLEDDLYGLFTKDPVYASKAMMYNALKEIHLTQPLNFFNAQMSALGKDLPEYKNLSPEKKQQLQNSVIPADTRRWLIDYVRTVIKGQQTQTDEWVNNLVNQSGLKGLINKALAPFGRTISRKPVTNFFQTVGRMQMASVIGPRPKLITRNKFQLTHNLALYGLKANIRAFFPPNKELKSLLDESLFLKSYTGLEELPVDLAKKIEQIWHKGYQWSATSNAKQAMECAYWQAREWIDNPKYKKHGWKPEHLLREMEFGGSATQFQYIGMGMPQVFRHKSLIPATRLTSWWMNYFAKFHREALHRAFTGRPSWAGPEGPTLPWSARLGWFRYLVLGGLILNTMGYTRSYMFGAAPTGWPPAMQFSWNLYLYIVTLGSEDKWKRAKNKLAKKRMLNALKTFIPGYIAYKDVEAIWTGRKNLSSLFFYKKSEPQTTAKRKKRTRREKRMLRR